MKSVRIFFFVLLSIPFLSLAQQQPVRTTLAMATRKVGLQPDLLRGPYLQMVTPTSITIRWRTSTIDRSRIKYGQAITDLNMKKEDSTLVYDHILKLTDLNPFTKYYYTIGSLVDTILQGGKDNYFYTLPVKGSEQMVRVVGFGDCGNNSINQRKVRDQVLNYLGDDKYMNAWILMGDNTYDRGTDPEFQAKFFNVYKDDMLKKFPLYPVPGNHDYSDIVTSSVEAQTKMAYYQNFSVPTKGEAGGVPSNTKSYYSYDIGNVHFLALDSYGRDNISKRMLDGAGEQVDWIRKDLQANKSKWVVAYWHHPPYTMGSHNSDKEMDLVRIRQNFIKVLEDYGVDLVLCGHSHVYERTKLIKGYTGMEADYDAKKYEISSSTALYDGSKNSAPYVKSSKNNQGTVYVVSGSAGQLGGHTLTYPHDAMYYSNYEVGGSVMLEIEGNKLDLKWICSDGQIRDHFTMMKDVTPKEEKILVQDKQLTN